jgi:hypothetical protein
MKRKGRRAKPTNAHAVSNVLHIAHFDKLLQLLHKVDLDVHVCMVMGLLVLSECLREEGGLGCQARLSGMASDVLDATSPHTPHMCMLVRVAGLMICTLTIVFERQAYSSLVAVLGLDLQHSKENVGVASLAVT